MSSYAFFVFFRSKASNHRTKFYFHQDFQQTADCKKLQLVSQQIGAFIFREQHSNFEANSELISVRRVDEQKVEIIEISTDITRDWRISI